MTKKTTTAKNESPGSQIQSLNEEIDLILRLRAYDRACKDDDEIRALFFGPLLPRKTATISTLSWITLVVITSVLGVIAYYLW